MKRWNGIAILLIVLNFSCAENKLVLNYSASPFELGKVKARFAKDIPYDKKPRTKLDLWLPNSEKPAGLVVYTHGGGFISGDKEYVYSPQKNGKWDFPRDIKYLLAENIAFATVNYSFLEQKNEKEGVLKPMNDVKRAVQFLRKFSSDLNIDKGRVVLAGNSAGAGISLWIAMNDEMADPKNSDPILRESTRVAGVAVRETQSTYDAESWCEEVFKGELKDALDIPQFRSKFKALYGVASPQEFFSERISEYRKSVDMLSLLTADDPEIWAENILENSKLSKKRQALGSNHHAYHVRALKEKADEVGLSIVCYYGKKAAIYKDSSGEGWVEFILRKIGDQH